MDFIANDYWIMILSAVLIADAISMYFIKNLLHAVIIFGVYSIIMALIWLFMNTPDLAITEAAAGICMTVLLMGTIFKTSRKDE